MAGKSSASDGNAIASLTVPDSINEGIIMMLSHGYTNNGSMANFIIPDGIKYETLFDGLAPMGAGSAGTNGMSMKAIKASGIAGKQFQVKTNATHNAGRIFLIY